MSDNEIDHAVAAFKVKTRALLNELNGYAGEGARRYPAEYVAAERARIRDDLRALDGELRATVAAAHARQIAVADETYAKDPRDPAAITADELQIARLARLHPDRVSAQSHLLPEARRFAQMGEPGRARVYLEAARLSGATDAQAERAVERSLDATLPNRVAALQARAESVAAYSDAEIAAATTRNLAAVLTGDAADAARSSIRAKSFAWEQAQAEGRQYADPVGLALPGAAE